MAALKKACPHIVSGDFGEWVVDDKTMNVPDCVEFSRRLGPPVSLPAVDALLSLAKIDERYDAFGEVTELQNTLRSLRNLSMLLDSQTPQYFSAFVNIVVPAHTYAQTCHATLDVQERRLLPIEPVTS